MALSYGHINGYVKLNTWSILSVRPYNFSKKTS